MSNLELENKIKFLYSIRGDVEMRQKIPLLVDRLQLQSSFKNPQVLRCFLWQWFTLLS